MPSILVSCSLLFSSLPLDPTWLICCFLEPFETTKTKATTKSLLYYCPYNLLFTDWFYSQFPQYLIPYILSKFSKQSYFQAAVSRGSFILCLRKLSNHSFLVILFQQTRYHFLHCFPDSCYFSFHTNLYVVSSPAFGCNRPLTRLQSHSSLQTSCSLVSLRHSVSCLISPIFCFLAVDPNSPSQCYCCFCLIHLCNLIPPSLFCLAFSFILLGEEPERGPGADKSDYTGWAGSLSVVVVVGSLFLLRHSCRYDHTQVFWIKSQSRPYRA